MPSATVYTKGRIDSILAISPTAVKTANYTAVPGDLVIFDISGASRVLTLPTAPADGSRIAAKVIATAGTNTLTINCGGSDVFNKAGGPATATLSLLNQLVVLQYKAGIWYVVGDDLPLSQLDLRHTTPKSSLSLARWAALLQAPARPLVWDNFYRPDSSTSLGTADSGQAWTAQANTWGLTNSQAYMVTASGEGYATISLQEPADFAQADVYWGTLKDPGLLLRWVDASNYLLVALEGTTIILWRKLAGVFTNLAQTTISPTGAGALYGLEATYDRGTGIVAGKASFGGGVFTATATLSTANRNTFETNTIVGLRSGSGDNTSRYCSYMAGVTLP